MTCPQTSKKILPAFRAQLRKGAGQDIDVRLLWIKLESKGDNYSGLMVALNTDKHSILFVLSFCGTANNVNWLTDEGETEKGVRTYNGFRCLEGRR